MERSAQPLQPPKVSQSTNAAALPKGGEEIEREAVLGWRRCVPGRAWVYEWVGEEVRA